MSTCNSVWKGLNHTKALNHALGYDKDINPCRGSVASPYCAIYKAMYDKKNGVGNERKVPQQQIDINLDTNIARTLSIMEFKKQCQGTQKQACTNTPDEVGYWLPSTASNSS